MLCSLLGQASSSNETVGLREYPYRRGFRLESTYRGEPEMHISANRKYNVPGSP